MILTRNVNFNKIILFLRNYTKTSLVHMKVCTKLLLLTEVLLTSTNNIIIKKLSRLNSKDTSTVSYILFVLFFFIHHFILSIFNIYFSYQFLYTCINII